MDPSIHRGPPPWSYPTSLYKGFPRSDKGDKGVLVECWGFPVIKRVDGVNMYLVNNAGTPLLGPLIGLIKIKPYNV